MFRMSNGLLLATGFIAYTALGDQRLVEPQEIERAALVDATIDRGPVLEVILRCPQGTAIISYSKAEQLYCSPQLTCDGQIERIIARTCR